MIAVLSIVIYSLCNQWDVMNVINLTCCLRSAYGGHRDSYINRTSYQVNIFSRTKSGAVCVCVCFIHVQYHIYTFRFICLCWSLKNYNSSICGARIVMARECGTIENFLNFVKNPLIHIQYKIIMILLNLLALLF